MKFFKAKNDELIFFVSNFFSGFSFLATPFRYLFHCNNIIINILKQSQGQSRDREKSSHFVFVDDIFSGCSWTKMKQMAHMKGQIRICFPNVFLNTFLNV